MTAKELFERLGFPKNATPIFEDWIMYGEELKKQVTFDLMFRTVTCNCSITPELHQAIHQQMIELGWIEGETYA